MKNVVIYARYSSYKQTEMSIEGQLKACTEYAENNGFVVIDTYIDRALSARSDKRPQFQKMVKDSAKQEFSAVLVFQLDRFSRNRYDSAIYKKQLEENGVRVLSVKEEISEDSSGILTESVIEAIAEYFSAQLSEKVTRGMMLNAEKCKYNGGALTLGFRIDENKDYQIDENLAPTIKKVFEKYASGETMVQIMDWLNSIGVKTARGNNFSKNSLQHILRNEKYIGTYTFKNVTIPNGIPQIVSNDLFNKVQARLSCDQRKGGKYKAEEEYLLTGKLYCGYCRSKMVGISGKSKSGQIYRYYSCHSGKEANQGCKKKNVSKDYIEEKVIKDCYSILTDDMIEIIAERTVAMSENQHTKNEIARMEKLVRSKEANIETLMDSLESGIIVNRIAKRIKERESEINELKKQIILQKKNLMVLTVDEVAFFLTSLREGRIDSKKYKKIFIETLIDRIYLFDDKYTVYFKFGDSKTIKGDQKYSDLDNVQMNPKQVYQHDKPQPIGWGFVMF